MSSDSFCFVKKPYKRLEKYKSRFIIKLKKQTKNENNICKYFSF